MLIDLNRPWDGCVVLFNNRVIYMFMKVFYNNLPKC